MRPSSRDMAALCAERTVEDGATLHGRGEGHRHRPARHRRIPRHKRVPFCTNLVLARRAGGGGDATAIWTSPSTSTTTRRWPVWPSPLPAFPRARRTACSSRWAPAWAAASSSTARCISGTQRRGQRDRPHDRRWPAASSAPAATAGCWERYASATAIIREARKYAQAPSATVQSPARWTAIWTRSPPRPSSIWPRPVRPDAAELFDSYVQYLCYGLVNLINLYRPGDHRSGRRRFRRGRVPAERGAREAAGAGVLQGDAVRAHRAGHVWATTRASSARPCWDDKSGGKGK